MSLRGCSNPCASCHALKARTGVDRAYYFVPLGRDEAWKQGITPWDSQDGSVRAPLKELIEEKKFPLPTEGRVAYTVYILSNLAKVAVLPVPIRRAIVPGCGRGYDAAYFARLGLESWGVDISPNAVDAAKMVCHKLHYNYSVS